MYFDVTRHGGRRTLRIRAEAIAWLDEIDGTTIIHLIGGETMRVNEGREEIERRSTPLDPEDLPPATETAEPEPTVAVVVEHPRHQRRKTA